jgi:secreted trypsin-like serine protease
MRIVGISISVVLTLLTSFVIGERAAHAQIVGGTAARPGEWPDVVAVFAEDGSMCTGTLLGADLVLTAGHCIGGGPTEVLVGSVDIARPDGQRRRVKWSKAYPRWESMFDVGVVMLENPVFAKQRAIAEHCTTGKRNRLTRGTRVQVVGFGLTTAAATDDNTKLHAATIEVVDGMCAMDGACKEDVAPGGEFTAGGHGVDACFGDSGGPVYIGTSSGPALVGTVSRGLASWSEPCGEGGVFVRVEPVIDWIQRETGRVVDRVECDRPGDDGTDDSRGSEDADGATASSASGCNAAGIGGAGVGGAVAGLFGNGLAIAYAGALIAVLRRTRRRRA